MKKSKLLLPLLVFSLSGCNNNTTNTTNNDNKKVTITGYEKKDEENHIVKKSDGSSKTESHSWDDGEITLEVTETTDGVKTYTCELCEAVKTEKIPSTGIVRSHSWSTSWSKDSNYHWKQCTDATCNEINDKAAHSWNSGAITTAATATTDGVKTFTCTVCGQTKTEKIPATGGGQQVHSHSWATSWTSDDSYHWKKCTDSTCNEINSKAAHSWNSGVVTTAATATTDGVKTYTCTVCNKTKTEKIPATGGGGGQATTDPFSITTNLTVVKEIHTSEQKTYLAYTGDYATMDPSKYPDGKALKSDSLPVDIAWNFTPASGKTVKNYAITVGQKSDLSDGYEMKGTTAKSISYYNPFLGTNYFKLTAYYTDNTSVSSEIKTFKVDETAPRNLAVGGMTNCRDMGGRTTISGGKVKQGLIYRTSGNKFDYSTTINDSGKEVMLKQLGVKTEINVADGTSYDVKLSGTTTYDCYMDYGGSAKHHFSRNAESVKNVFKLLSDENNYPVFYHCRIGTDRTGLIGNLVYGLLGVPLNMIYQDYLFSNFGNIQNKRYIGSQAGEDDISVYMEEINSMPGATYQEKVYNTLLSIGVPRETLDTVINILTEGTKPNDQKGQIAVDVNNMNVTGGSVTHATRSNITDRSNPEYYLTLGSSVSASYTFTTTESGTKKIYGYLGHNNNDTKKISDSVSVSVDGNTVSVPATTFKDAGMGNIKNRTNYYFVSLGQMTNLAAGEHTITITGKANDMKLGTLSIFGTPETGSQTETGGGSEGGGSTVVEGEPIKFMISNSTGFKNPSDKMKSDATWVINSTNLPAGNYKVGIEFKITISDHGKRTMMETDVNPVVPTYTLYIGSTSYGPVDTSSTRSALGVNTSSWKEITYANSVAITGDTLAMKLSFTGNGYSMYVNSVVFTPIA